MRMTMTIEGLQRELHKLKSENGQLRQRLSTPLGELELENQRLKSKNEHLRYRNEQLEASVGEPMEVLEDQVKRLTSDNASLRGELKSVRADKQAVNQANRELHAENKELEARVRVLKDELDQVSPPTREEIRAAYLLGVGIPDLRAWARAGVGPQPPYDDVESWMSWVEARRR